MGSGSASPTVVSGRRLLPRPRLPLPERLPHLLPELALLLAVNAAYKYGRKLANGHRAEAFHHAGGVWSFERWAHLPSERAVQQGLLHSVSLVHAANWVYATVHFPAMLAFLGWMFVRKPAHYLWIRRAIVVQTMLALLGHLFFPLAPPRMLPEHGMVDTAAAYGPAVYGKPDGHSMANQYAAMPSLHVGWALAIAVGLIAAYRSHWRWLWLLHPLVTTLVVVATGNHYWLDCLVGSALLGVALAVIPGPAVEPPRGRPRRWAWPVRVRKAFGPGRRGEGDVRTDGRGRREHAGEDLGLTAGGGRRGEDAGVDQRGRAG
jgi:PAP2 superfamily protein